MLIKDRARGSILSLIFLLVSLVFCTTAYAQWRPAKQTGLNQTPPLQLHNLSGKVVIVNFWASWCEPCREEFGELIHLQEKYGPKGLKVLAINLAEMKPRIMQFLKGNGISENAIEILLDRNSTAYKSWNARGLPTTFLISRNGAIEGAWIGAIENSDGDEVKGKIESLLRQ
jgi:thiol-disulfide isomerase/thioredoxin